MLAYSVLLVCLGFILGVMVGVVVTLRRQRARRQLRTTLEARIRETAKQLGKRVRIMPTDSIEKLTDKLENLTAQLVVKLETVVEEELEPEQIEGNLTLTSEGVQGDGAFANQDNECNDEEEQEDEQRPEEGDEEEG